MRKASDGADHERTLAILIDAGLVENIDGATFQIVRIKQHVPSPELLEKLEQDKARAARYRKHKSGVHDDCLPERCKAAASRDASRSLSRDARDGDGTGQAVTGSTTPLTSEEQETLAELDDEHNGLHPNDPDLYAHEWENQ